MTTTTLKFASTHAQEPPPAQERQKPAPESIGRSATGCQAEACNVQPERAGMEMLEIVSEFFPGKPMISFLTDAQRSHLEEAWGRVGRENWIEREIELTPPVGPPLRAAVVGAAIRDKAGRLAALHWTLQDASGRTPEPMTLDLEAEVERRVAQRLAEADSAVQLKDHFLATLSHELRAPLMPVLALASQLEAHEHLSPDVRRLVEMIRRNLRIEAQLLDDLFDLTRMARGKLTLQRQMVDVERLLRDAIDTCCVEGVLSSGHLHVETDFRAGGQLLLADPTRLMQVFWNLLGNAVKFTPAGGRVTIRCRVEECAPSGQPAAGAPARKLIVEIQDTGIGIEPEMLPRIFNAYEQGDPRINRQFGGLGLGLSISRSIVELHGGRLDARSEGKNRGATFTVELPIEAVAPAPEKPAPEFPPGTSSPTTANRRSAHILLVEDQSDTAEVLAMLLSGMGYRITTASQITSALEAATTSTAGSAEDAIDLVIADLGLPDGSGLDLMRQLADRYKLKGIALSGYGMDEDIRACRQAGFQMHLLKPVDCDQLARAVESCLASDASKHLA